MQLALNTFGSLCRKMGLLINEEKTKFQCRAMSSKVLTLNNKHIERVRSYKYLGVYVGYTADSRDAELNHILMQSRTRMQPLRSLAWGGNGAGVPVLRSMCISTVRSVIDYASPVLFCLDEGRFGKLEKLQNESMRLILNCPKNAMVDAMRQELALPTVKHRVEELNLTSVIKHIRNAGGYVLLKDIEDYINNTRTFRRQGRRGYINNLVNSLREYDLISCCKHFPRVKMPPPWEEKQPQINIKQLTKKKSMHSADELRELFEPRTLTINTCQVFCDGSVMENGRAGCGVLIRDYVPEMDTWAESEHSYRLSDDISPTQAELYAMLCGLKEIENGVGDAQFYVDSRGALESLSSAGPVFRDIVGQCRNAIHNMSLVGREVTFSWLPSHVGITYHDRVDEVAKNATKKDTIDIHCPKTLTQIKTKIRKHQHNTVIRDMTAKYTARPSTSMTHYLAVHYNTDFTYGKHNNKWKESLCTRLRLGYKYYWEIGVACTDQDTACKLCREPGGHTLNHYTLECPSLLQYRNINIHCITDQIIWMFQHGKVREMMNKCKNIKDIIR